MIKYITKATLSRRLAMKTSDCAASSCTTNCRRIAAPIPTPITLPVYRLPAKYIAVL